MTPRLATFALTLLLASCAYILPATWRSFRAHPDDAAPAITRALDRKQLKINTWDQENRRIVTNWIMLRDGTSAFRERYVITWEKDDEPNTVTVFVRHEAQDQESGDGAPTWSTTHHDTSKEDALLDAVTSALQAMRT